VSAYKRILRYVSVSDAREMCGEDKNGDAIEGSTPSARRITRKKAPLRDIQLLNLEKASRGSPASLTLADAEANAAGSAHYHLRRFGRGDDGRPDVEVLGNRVDRAMTKLEHWPSVGDTRAVRVGPMGVMDPRKQDPTYSIIVATDQEFAKAMRIKWRYGRPCWMDEKTFALVSRRGADY
jgi:hypothetical protein